MFFLNLGEPLTKYWRGMQYQKATFPEYGITFLKMTVWHIYWVENEVYTANARVLSNLGRKGSF